MTIENYMDKIEEINNEIDKLIKKREKIFEDTEEKNITSLEWTKECTATFEINFLDAAGLPKYKIFVFGKHPKPFKMVHISGDSKLYENNITYGKDYGWFEIERYCFQTSNRTTALEFLKNTKFKELNFDRQQYETLDAVKKIAENSK